MGDLEHSGVRQAAQAEAEPGQTPLGAARLRKSHPSRIGRTLRRRPIDGAPNHREIRPKPPEPERPSHVSRILRREPSARPPARADVEYSEPDTTAHQPSSPVKNVVNRGFHLARGNVHQAAVRRLRAVGCPGCRPGGLGDGTVTACLQSPARSLGVPYWSTAFGEVQLTGAG